MKVVRVSDLEVVEDVADEGDVANPLLSGALSQLLTILELLLQPVQQVPPEHAAVVLLGFSLDGRKRRKKTISNKRR